MTDDEILRFEEEDETAPAAGPGAVWPVLVVDDDEEVHAATRFAVGNTHVLGRTLELIDAHSAEEALRILRERPDVAVAMLDVVMERSDAGLWLVGRIREELGLTAIRIVLRTGQPGYAPEFDVIRQYDINDYRTKSELTRVRLLTMLTAAIRSYAQLRDAERSRKALSAIVRASTGFVSAHGRDTFGLAALHGLESMLEQDLSGVVITTRAGRVNGGGPGEPYVCAATRRLAPLAGAALARLPDGTLAARLARRWDSGTDALDGATCVLALGNRAPERALLYAELSRPVDEPLRGLLPVFATTMGASFANVLLFEQLTAYAYCDPLTALPNRTMFVRRVQERMDGERTGWTAAIVDIDHFSAINDALGHELGDRLLEQVGRRLRDAFPAEAVVARVAGDAFGVLAPAAMLDPQRILALFAVPLPFDASSLQVSVSLGLVRLEDSSGSGLGALKEANIALNRSKHDQRGLWHYYERQMEADTRERLGLVQALRAVLERDGLEVHFQPQIDLATGRIVGAEALVRWRGTDGGFIPPDRFVPVAEYAGLIVPLGEFVLRTACRQLLHWQGRGLSGMRVAVNVSLGQFRSPDFTSRVAAIIGEFGLDARDVELEITESMAMEDIATVVATLERLKRIGVQIAVDDFGTGFSSLGHLQRLAVDRIKIDRIFIEQLDRATGQASIPEMIVRLGQNLGLRVIAEGVETSAHADALRRLGCHEAQGYFIARPMDPAAFERWLAHRGLLP
jgi:diguanylate cyclase (GGDEF)-like protein